MHPYAGGRIGLATIHAKERAIAPPFRRLMGADVVVAPNVDTDTLGTFSGEVPRPDALVETSLLKAELVFNTLDVDCAVASEGSYGPIDRLPFIPSGVEIMAFVDRRRGLRFVETLGTHRTNWRLQRFGQGDPRVPAVLKSMGFPQFGVFVICGSDPTRPIKGLTEVDEVVAAIDQEAARSEDGEAILISDMRAHLNPTRMKVLRALAWKLAKRLSSLCPRCGTPGFGHMHSRRGLPCEHCGEPTHWIDFEIDSCHACGFSESRPRADGRRAAPRSACRSCRP
ncbi:hypothetical protein SAMN02745126_04284 [Enhydrobacter aerosaccus]|uniref:DUF6671 domain-containing protein n=1 Tax=Enhydrobacter aerosaccus TaxID=225324 RepID=A0A1T4S1U9_9HYPH|nr:DUF6671 family protein [Enhydrobacter aerosaccus]SKA22147.1 hypothetical protein SAMN02745126_04284 [Enhydrobacter aerosaccus]